MNQAQANPMNQGSRRLRKGELLFIEGENSRAMYFLKKGMIRLYKKKGDSVIELDTVHSGQVLGELAFLDGNPRSASGEALTECELVEISGAAFQQVLSKMPDWLKILLKTIVTRLRTASTRIRQLESASTAYDYSDRDGRRSAHYVYLSPIDVLKISSAVLLVSAHYGKEIRVGVLQRYANQIMGIPVAKITSFMDILTDAGLLSMQEAGDSTRIMAEDVDFLEELISYLNEENLLEPSKRHDITGRGFYIMSLVNKHLAKQVRDELTGLSTLNLADIKAAETAASGKEPFRIEEIQQLVKLGYTSNLTIKSSTEVYCTLDTEKFSRAYRLQKVVMAINMVNEQKRASGGK